jgi:hypothetical protein
MPGVWTWETTSLLTKVGPTQPQHVNNLQLGCWWVFPCQRVYIHTLPDPARTWGFSWLCLPERIRGVCPLLSGGPGLDRAGRRVNLVLSCQAAALAACPTHGDCLLQLNPDCFRAQNQAGDTAFTPRPDSAARTPWRSEEADKLPNTLPPTLSLPS